VKEYEAAIAERDAVIQQLQQTSSFFLQDKEGFSVQAQEVERVVSHLAPQLTEAKESLRQQALLHDKVGH